MISDERLNEIIETLKKNEPSWYGFMSPSELLDLLEELEIKRSSDGDKYH